MVNVVLQKVTVLDVQHVILAAIAKLVNQIIIVIAGNASPVLSVKRHHRAVHLLHRVPAAVATIVVNMRMTIIATYQIIVPVERIPLIAVAVVVDSQHQQ